jgi:hypothetical protein
MLHNDYFADEATHAYNFRRRYRMIKGLFMNTLHGVREFDPYFKLVKMGDFCQNNHVSIWSKELSLCFATVGLQEGCRASIWCASSLICYCSVPFSKLFSRTNVGGDVDLCDHAQHDHRG